MKITKIALMGLTLAFMAPSVQAAEPIDQEAMDAKIANIKERYPLTWEQTADCTLTGIASGLAYGAFLSKGSLLGVLASWLVMKPLKNMVLQGDLPTDKPRHEANKQERLRYYATWEKNNNVDNVATLITTLGVLAVNAAMGHITAV
jgi:hypothetical protein